jgi:hypothetical protein
MKTDDALLVVEKKKRLRGAETQPDPYPKKKNAIKGQRKPIVHTRKQRGGRTAVRHKNPNNTNSGFAMVEAYKEAKYSSSKKRKQEWGIGEFCLHEEKRRQVRFRTHDLCSFFARSSSLPIGLSSVPSLVFAFSAFFRLLSPLRFCASLFLLLLLLLRLLLRLLRLLHHLIA